MSDKRYIWVVECYGARPDVKRYTLIKQTDKQWHVKERAGENYIRPAASRRVFLNEADMREWVRAWFARRIAEVELSLALLKEDAAAPNQGVEVWEIPDEPKPEKP